MASKKLLCILNVQVCLLILLHVWTITKSATGNGGGNITGGNVATNLSISGNNEEAVPEKAKRRGWMTAAEFAAYDHTSLETVYRHAAHGDIKGAELVGGRWHIPLP